MHNPTKKTGGGPCVSLSPVSGGGTVQPWRRRPSTALHVAYPPRQTQPSWNVGGEQVVFTVASPKHGTANHLNPPTPPPLRRTKHLCNGRRGGTGGVHRGVAQARHCKSQPPPPQGYQIQYDNNNNEGQQDNQSNNGNNRGPKE